MSFIAIIPARYASARLPGKPLREICGKPMIAHVIEQARNSGASQIIVATDDQRIADVAANYDIDVCLTSPDHNSGTERISEVIERYNIADETVIVNVQGDEPLMPGSCINQVGQALLDDTSVDMATLQTPVINIDEMFDWNVIKLVCDKNGYALYFSRAPIPWDREAFKNGQPGSMDLSHCQRHIGLYGYRAGFIKEYINWGPSDLESVESLEQLRVLYNGKKIKVVTAHDVPGPGVNTEEELQAVERILGNK